ncbi:MAG: hypothetical protein RL699_1918 [Bacteroidota bacterium]|jgi:hypothetical protein
MRKLIGILVVLVFLGGCSSTDPVTPNPDPDPVVPTDYCKMSVDGTEFIFDPLQNNAPNAVYAQITGDKFKITFNSLFFAGSTNWTRFELVFTKQGKFMSCTRYSGFSSYKYYPAHYFNLTIDSLDEINKKIKLHFSGKIYLNKLNLNSEANDLSGELEMKYSGDETAYGGMTIGPGIPQFCTAKFNGTAWNALFEHSYSSFTAEDPYKIFIHFGVNATQPGTYPIQLGNSDANGELNRQETYVAFYKFNTQTLQFDRYVVTGELAYSYREYHGGNEYSYMGTFHFTAVNPNDPNDTIQVTDGDFRSYQ